MLTNGNICVVRSPGLGTRFHRKGCRALTIIQSAQVVFLPIYLASSGQEESLLSMCKWRNLLLRIYQLSIPIKAFEELNFILSKKRRNCRFLHFGNSIVAAFQVVMGVTNKQTPSCILFCHRFRWRFSRNFRGRYETTAAPLSWSWLPSPHLFLGDEVSAYRHFLRARETSWW